MNISYVITIFFGIARNTELFYKNINDSTFVLLFIKYIHELIETETLFISLL